MKKRRLPKEKKMFDRSDFISLLAVIISVGAFAVSLFEAHILKEQQELMQVQQKAAVWPYLEHGIVYSYDTAQAAVRFAIGNKGVGPARIDGVVLYLQEQPIEDYTDISDIIRQLFPPEADFSISYASPTGVLSADESYQILQISSHRFAGDTEYYRKIQLGFRLCYCSIYGDCWTLTEEPGEPREGCLSK